MSPILHAALIRSARGRAESIFWSSIESAGGPPRTAPPHEVTSDTESWGEGCFMSGATWPRLTGTTSSLEKRACKGVKMAAGDDGETDCVFGRPEVRVRKAVRRAVEDVLRSGV